MQGEFFFRNLRQDWCPVEYYSQCRNERSCTGREANCRGRKSKLSRGAISYGPLHKHSYIAYSGMDNEKKHQANNVTRLNSQMKMIRSVMRNWSS